MINFESWWTLYGSTFLLYSLLPREAEVNAIKKAAQAAWEFSSKQMTETFPALPNDFTAYYGIVCNLCGSMSCRGGCFK